jgi:SOS-response transcriptional repressor LexA
MYESGQRRIDLNDLKRVADHYGVSLTYFLGEDIESNRIQAELRRATEALEETRKRLEEVVPYAGEWIWLPLIGTVPAGYPEWQEEHEAEEFYPCSVEQIKKRDGAFALRVKGDSMIERRIVDGDIIFVDANRQAQPGDVVVTRKHEEVVLRIYKEDAKGPYLQASKQGYPILRLKDARVLGVVVGSYREKP